MMQSSVQVRPPAAQNSLGAPNSQRRTPGQGQPTKMSGAELLFRRSVALFIDGFLLFILLMFLTRIPVASLGIPSPPNPGNFGISPQFLYVNSAWIFVSIFAYFCLFEIIVGATPGKLTTGLRVLNKQGNPAAAWQVIVRNLFLFIECLLVPFLITPPLDLPWRFVPWLFVISLLLMIFTPKHQRLGDIVARAHLAPTPPRPNVYISRQSRISKRLHLLRRMMYAVALVEIAVILCSGYLFWRGGDETLQVWSSQSTYKSVQGKSFDNYEPGLAKRTLDDNGEPILLVEAHFTLFNYYDSLNSQSTFSPNTRYTCNGTFTWHWHPLVGWIMDPPNLKEMCQPL